MDRKQKMIAVVSVAITVLAVSAVTAGIGISNTPLYTVRMEQASSEMNFLPTEMNGFTYTAENRCTLNYDILGGCSGVEPLSTGDTCEPACEPTEGGYTCSNTCWRTCDGSTCEGTCNEPTCGYTCYTCPAKTCDP